MGALSGVSIGSGPSVPALATDQKLLPSQRNMKDLSHAEQSNGGEDDCIEYGLYVGGRLTDHPQDIGGGRLTG